MQWPWGWVTHGAGGDADPSVAAQGVTETPKLPPKGPGTKCSFWSRKSSLVPCSITLLQCSAGVVWRLFPSSASALLTRFRHRGDDASFVGPFSLQLSVGSQQSAGNAQLSLVKNTVSEHFRQMRAVRHLHFCSLLPGEALG